MKNNLQKFPFRNFPRFTFRGKRIHPFCLILFLVPVFVVFVSFRTTEKEDQKGEYITMRIYENFTVTSSKIILVYADDKSEIIDLVPFKFNDDYLVKNNQVITRTLNKLRKEGFKIVSSTASGEVTSNRDMMITTFILER
ncbi:MAG: hypothetical protein NTW10_04680 [Bacteroidetes bacterium]|nr:hypothetical protein [Bacteroidota bacterium]